MNEQFIKLKEDNNKYSSDVQENVNVSLNEMTKIIQNLKTEFSKEIETLKIETQAELKIELKKNLQ